MAEDICTVVRNFIHRWFDFVLQCERGCSFDTFSQPCTPGKIIPHNQTKLDMAKRENVVQ